MKEIEIKMKEVKILDSETAQRITDILSECYKILESVHVSIHLAEFVLEAKNQLEKTHDKMLKLSIKINESEVVREKIETQSFYKRISENGIKEKNRDKK